MTRRRFESVIKYLNKTISEELGDDYEALIFVKNPEAVIRQVLRDHAEKIINPDVVGWGLPKGSIELTAAVIARMQERYNKSITDLVPGYMPDLRDEDGQSVEYVEFPKLFAVGLGRVMVMKRRFLTEQLKQAIRESGQSVDQWYLDLMSKYNK